MDGSVDLLNFLITDLTILILMFVSKNECSLIGQLID